MPVRVVRRLTMISLIGLLGLYALAPLLRRAPGRPFLAASAVQEARFSGGGDWGRRSEDQGCAIHRRSIPTVHREPVCGESPVLFSHRGACRSDRLMRSDRAFFAWVQAQGALLRRRIFKKPRQA
jgi:hypothetical protein